VTLTSQDRSLLEYLNAHCDAPDQSGFITIPWRWNDAEDAPAGHAKEIARSVAVTGVELQALVSRLEQLGLVGKGRTSHSLRVWITAFGQDAIRAEHVWKSDDNRKEARVGIEVFISHSSKDVIIAYALTDLLRAALNLPAERIRCTSVSGYKLPVGADTDEHLRREIYESRSFIGLITELSFESAYVLFELGARWGADKPMAPLLAAGTSPRVLKGPIGGKTALSCDNPADLHQLIDDIGRELNCAPAKPASFNDKIERLIEVSKAMQSERAQQAAPPPAPKRQDDESDELSTEEIRYLMTLSRPRNRNRVPIGYFDSNPNQKEEAYREMMEHFMCLGLIRYGDKTYVFTKQGYERADICWRSFILKKIAELQALSSDYVEAYEVAKAVSLTDGEVDANEADRHIRALEKAGLVTCLEDSTSLGALITPEGRGELGKVEHIDFGTINT
jgi:DNA-binding MarR family transcriptional regulator